MCVCVCVFSSNSHIRGGGGGESCNILAKPLDFRASNGENIRVTDLSPPKPNWSRTPMPVTDCVWDCDMYSMYMYVYMHVWMYRV